MDVKTLREELKLTQEQFAKRVGLKSKGYVSDLETGRIAGCSVRAALEIEKLSGGKIPASSLSPDVKLVEQARGG